MRLLKPPAQLTIADHDTVVFLAGSIEMGRAEPWQERVTEALSGTAAVVLNPRRDDWDASWQQTLQSPQFVGQVEWELDGLDRADVIAFYLQPGTRSPISLMELGLHARTASAVVCCPEGFWRKGNVDVVCRRYGIEQVTDLEALCAAVRGRVEDRR